MELSLVKQEHFCGVDALNTIGDLSKILLGMIFMANLLSTSKGQQYKTPQSRIDTLKCKDNVIKMLLSFVTYEEIVSFVEQQGEKTTTLELGRYMLEL